MKRMLKIACLLLLSGALNKALADDRCDRGCLVRLMDQYLAALSKHDPSMVPLSPGVKLVENTRKIRVGEGLWATASAGPGAFRIYAADPAAGQVGFIGVIQVKHEPAILAAKLKLVAGKITEIDHLIRLNPKEPISKNFVEPRAALAQPLKPDEKISREQMLKTANSYYEAIVKVNGKLAPFAPECQRRENGVITVNARQTPEEAAKDDFSVFRKMT